MEEEGDIIATQSGRETSLTPRRQTACQYSHNLLQIVLPVKKGSIPKHIIKRCLEHQ